MRHPADAFTFAQLQNQPTITSADIISTLGEAVTYGLTITPEEVIATLGRTKPGTNDVRRLIAITQNGIVKSAHINNGAMIPSYRTILKHLEELRPTS